MTVDYSSLARTLTETLALGLPPIAVTTTDTVPDGVARLGHRVPAGCTFWQEAAKGAFATDAADHGSCGVGMYTHGLPMAPQDGAELTAALAVFADLKYVTADDVAKIPVLKQSRAHVVYSPLATAPLPPDVVMLFVRANQTLLLAEATESVDGGMAPAMGRPACAIVPQAVNSQRAALSLGCCGARAYVDALTDDVALYALPGAKLEAYVARLAELARANQILSKFHALRRVDVEAGKSPTMAESLARLQAAG